MRVPFFDMNPARLQKLWQQMLGVGSVIFLVLLIVVPIAWFIWFALFTKTFTVQAVTVVDARDYTAQAVQTLLEPMKGKNIFWLNTGLLEQNLTINVPQIRVVHIDRKLPSTLKVIVQEKQPVMLLVSQKKYYFVDEGGIAYEEAQLDTLPGVVLPTVKNSDPTVAVTLGSPVVDQSFITFIATVQKELPHIVPAQVVEIEIPSLAAREVHIQLSNNWIIKFDVTRTAEEQLGVLQKLLTGTIAAKDQPNIEYIDLRIPQRVYYKIKGATK